MAPLARRNLAQSGYDEGWIQQLIHDHPEVLPIDEIEPAFAGPISICRELPTDHGYVDNLYLTPSGGIVVVECKLWRNPEARRKAVAQVMDYASSLSKWRYSDLEAAVLRSKHRVGDTSIWKVISDNTELEEAAFVDAVSRNLRRGRMLCLLVGDGIREEAESLAEYLQLHAGLHFSLALVELAVFDTPDRNVIVCPRVPARTRNIDRGVVQIHEGVPSIQPVAKTGGETPRAASITHELFDEAISAVDAELPARIHAFLDEAERIGVHADMLASLVFRWSDPEIGSLNLGYIQASNGEFWTDFAPVSARKLGVEPLSDAYIRDLAGIIPDAVPKKGKRGLYLVIQNRGPIISEILEHQEEVIQAMGRFVEAVAANHEEETNE